MHYQYPPLSFYITKYDLTIEKYIELLDESIGWSGPYGYGTYMSRYEPASFQDSYDDWLAQEIFLIEDQDHFSERPTRFQVVKNKENKHEHKRRGPDPRSNTELCSVGP